jgi:hypothetical protein
MQAASEWCCGAAWLSDGTAPATSKAAEKAVLAAKRVANDFMIFSLTLF